MQHMTIRCLTVAAAVAATACASQPVVTTTSRTTTSSTTTSSAAGDVALGSQTGGMWADSVGGTWMDSTGAVWRGRGGAGIGLQPTDVGAFTNANIVSHLATGDSLEVALSQAGADRARSAAVRDFARRMVSEHSAHMQTGMQLAAQGGITPSPSPADTADAVMATHTSSRLSGVSDSAQFDRQFMRAEVMMHQHMLHELMMVRPQASGAALQLVDQTIPVVRAHLADAQSIWRQVGGGMRADMSGRYNP
jgi:predicted outer membrane protein